MRTVTILIGVLTLTFSIGLEDWDALAAPPTAAAVTGTVKLEGLPPRQRAIDMSKEPACVAVHKDGPPRVETVVVGPDGGLKNVVIYISEGLSAVAANHVSPDAPAMDQNGCQYFPHVLVVNPNQRFKVTNSDSALHNVHPMPASGSANREWNKSQTPGAKPIEEAWQAPEVAIHVKCNIHPWMSGYMVVVKGPHAVTNEKGSFRIENIPPGTYTLTAWQEQLGSQSQKITVTAGMPVTANFTFKAK